MVRVKLALWYNEIEEFGYDTFTTVANSIENHYERILNYFVNRRTNAAAEAFNAKIKAFRASFRGVVDKRFFLYRLAEIRRELEDAGKNLSNMMKYINQTIEMFCKLGLWSDTNFSGSVVILGGWINIC